MPLPHVRSPAASGERARLRFLAQDYPAANRKLLILDDAGKIAGQAARGWEVLTTTHRYASLPEKYNAMLAHEGPTYTGQRWDAVAVWDDDDIYLPWHLSAAAAALANGEPAAKPSAVWSLYKTAMPYREDATGRFHGSLVISADRLAQLGGWLSTRRANFDQQMITATGPHADMLAHSPHQSPSYVYRWQSTAAHHCSALMRTPADESWYDRTPITEPGYVSALVPRMDEEAARTEVSVRRNNRLARHLRRFLGRRLFAGKLMLDSTAEGCATGR